ncbi:DUF2625 domain-containing protein [Clostridium intestinale]|uniref:DUF2625 domain-containing protein n=1 Tax=Clostridium intestinale TaxID=36845 RepID=A0A7D6ZV09_9CLOT|nr:DUF2625 domain-containing protein [Clostridium intestinale]QLY80373.1 DUF2625 domain-containing protein [Clostridium intestinale]
MKQLNELINSEKSAWKLVDKWMNEAINEVEILKTSTENSERVLYDLQVTTKSVLGAIAYHCGGILIQGGWIRILGSGSNNIKRDVSVWNKLKIENENPRLNGALLVADDVVGGFFAINGGLFEGSVGNVFYLAPDTLKWEDLDLKFSEFIYWTFVGNIDKFYEAFRWINWKAEVQRVLGDEGFSIYPFLWAEGEDIDKRSRRVVPIEELWGLTIENRRKLGIV